jgi:predicted ATPase
MSEGTLRTLSTLAALYQGYPNLERRPTLVALDDVDAGIDLTGLAVLRDAMSEANLTTQVLASLHNPDLLDDKEISPDSILAVVAEGGGTRIALLDEGERSVLRDGLFTVAELMRASQLTPDPRLVPQVSNQATRLFDEAKAGCP